MPRVPIIQFPTNSVHCWCACSMITLTYKIKLIEIKINSAFHIVNMLSENESEVQK